MLRPSTAGLILILLTLSRVPILDATKAQHEDEHASRRANHDDTKHHHIVEQHPRNVDRFGPFEIHNNDNVIILPRQVHESISGHYSSKPEWMKGKTVRDWLADKSYEEQYRYGIEQLREAGVLK